jgi:hypothetical protein
MDATAIGVAEEEDREQGIDQENIFDRMVLGSVIKIVMEA